MARGALTIQRTNRVAGLKLALVAANAVDGHSFDNTDEDVAIIVKNDSASSINVTIITPITVDGAAIADKVVAVGAGEERFIGPFKNSIYGNADKSVYFDVSSATTVTVGAIGLGGLS